MLYDFMQMPRSEIADIFIDLHEKKADADQKIVELSHEVLELKIRNEKLVEALDAALERVRSHATVGDD